MEEEEFEFLEENRVSPTDFELVDAERVRNIDETEIVVHEDYFVNSDSKSSTSDDSVSEEDDFVPIKRSKRNKKSKGKAKKGLQTLTDVKAKIPQKGKNRTSANNISTKIVKNKPLYSQILQGAAIKANEDDQAKRLEEAMISDNEGTSQVVPEKTVQTCDSETENSSSEPGLGSEPVSDVEDSEVEVMEVRTVAPEELPAVKEDNDQEIITENKDVIAVPVDDTIDFRIVTDESPLESAQGKMFFHFQSSTFIFLAREEFRRVNCLYFAQFVGRDVFSFSYQCL